MAQAGRTRSNKQKRRAPSGGMIAAHSRSHTEAAIRKGVVPGAAAEQCPVCDCPSEGWYIEAGKRTWYHFARTFNCVERFSHVES